MSIDDDKPQSKEAARRAREAAALRANLRRRKAQTRAQAAQGQGAENQVAESQVAEKSPGEPPSPAARQDILRDD